MSPEPGRPREVARDAADQQLPLTGFSAPRAAAPGTDTADEALGADTDAPRDPVAKVLLDAHVPHLDRVFDYRVPAALDEQALAGARVSVPFSGRLLTGWLIERTATSEVGTRLLRLRRVLTPLPVLTPPVVELARAVAARSAGTVADVLRVAVPPRVARVDRLVLARRAAEAEAAAAPDTEPAAPEGEGSPATAAPETPAAVRAAWSRYDGGPEWLEAVGRGEPDRAVLEVLPAAPDHDWTDLTASALATAHRAGHGALAVVADRKALDRLLGALEPLVGAHDIVRLHAEDGPTPRYRGYLDLALGAKRLAVGTRSAAYAPVQDLRLVCCHDDADASYVEQRAPYQHVRDVLLLRAQLQDTAALFTGYSVSPEAQRLVNSRWARRVHPPRAVLRRNAPRTEATSDSFHSARDPLAARARLPRAAFRVAREALDHGPVLVQVARRGYAPFVACERCRAPARCPACGGPLSLRSAREAPVCAWCGRNAHGWRCPECDSQRMRLSRVGALRTAEELGRAFPRVPVISSSASTIRTEVGPEPAVVVATPGAEPVACDGYAAALLLDGNEMLARPWLRAEEQTLRRWCNAAALVRSAERGGTVVVTTDHDRAVGALVRWDPAGYAARQLRERHELGLPPAVRTAALTGPRDALAATLADLALPPEVRVVGPAPLDRAGGWSDDAAAEAPAEPDPRDEAQYRALLFFGYGVAGRVTAALRAEKARASALREHAPVTVRCDVTDLL